MSENEATPVKSESEWSPEIGALVAALAKAQLDFDPLLKDTDNPYYRSKYADLSSVIKATQKHLAANGLVVIQSPINREREAGVITLLAHSSGQWHKSSLFLPAVMQGKDGKERFDAQSVGSALTYARRYTYQAAIGIAAEIDDDANTAVGIGSSEAAKAVGKKKVDDLTTKLKGSIEMAEAKKNGEPALFYLWDDTSQTAEINGDESLKTKYRDVLKHLWQPHAKAIVANADELEALKYTFEKAGVHFRPLKATAGEGNSKNA